MSATRQSTIDNRQSTIVNCHFEQREKSVFSSINQMQIFRVARNEKSTAGAGAYRSLAIMKLQHRRASQRHFGLEGSSVLEVVNFTQACRLRLGSRRSTESIACNSYRGILGFTADCSACRLGSVTDVLVVARKNCVERRHHEQREHGAQ